MQLKIFIPFLLFFNSLSAQAQYHSEHSQYFSVQWIGVSYHPGGGSVRMRDNYPLRLDPKAYLVVNIGATANHDYELSKRFFLRSEAGFFMDCAWQKSGFLHVGLHFTALQIGRHSFNGGLGPMFLAREDWGKFENYRRGDDFFGNRVKNGWQYRFFPIGGELEYLYRINDHIQFQYSVIPGYPAVITSKLGLRIKI